MRTPSLPPEFVEVSGPGVTRAAVHREFEASVRELGLLTGDGAWLLDPASAPGVVTVVEGAGRTAAAVVSLPGHGERLHLRATRHGGWWAGLWGSRLLGPRRALVELAVADRLRAAGAPVARVVLAAAQRARPGWRAAVGSVFVEDARDGRRWLAETRRPAAVVAVARAAGRAVRRFHDAGGRHRDLHLGNLLIRARADGAPEVIVVDLDGARSGAPPGFARRGRELRRLQRSIHRCGLHGALGRRGQAAFLSGYCGGDRRLRRALLGRRRHPRLR